MFLDSDRPWLVSALRKFIVFDHSIQTTVPNYHAAAGCHSRLCRVVAVRFTPTGALPDGAPQGDSSDA